MTLVFSDFPILPPFSLVLEKNILMPRFEYTTFSLPKMAFNHWAISVFVYFSYSNLDLYVHENQAGCVFYV